MRVRWDLLGVAAALLVSAAASAANAAELVTNGGFETGNFSGWTQFGNTGFTNVADCPGPCYAFFGPVGSTGGIQQMLATVAGSTYAVSFDLESDGEQPSSVDVFLGGVDLFSLTDPPASSGFVNHIINVTASQTNAVLSFAFRDDPGREFLDNVSVTQVAGGVPEPATWALMIGGFGIAGAALRRRRAALGA
jgi:hypothetical protein